jgi:DNA-binding NtrC family response regulator
MMREQLVALVEQMIDRGVRFEDAQREFERTFLMCALTKTKFNVCKTAAVTGLHRNTVSRKMTEYRIKKTA